MPVKIKMDNKSFDRTFKYFDDSISVFNLNKIKKIAEEAVEKFKEATPKKSMLTANSWDYILEETPKGFSLSFINNNVKNGANIAVILDSGHATPNGKWVNGEKYLDKTTKEVYDGILEETWEELKNL